MNHGINTYYQNRFSALNPVQPRANVREATGATPSQQAAPARAAHTSARTVHSGLSAAEQQMIDRYFPPSEAMTLRLYGPGQGTRTLNPASLGSRLDLQG
jgi:hypothetical protein